MQLKRKITAIIVGVVLSIPIGTILSYTPFLKDLDTTQVSYSATFTFIVTGIITGYIARTKGWLCSAILPPLIYLLAFLAFIITFANTVIINEHISLQTIINTPIQGDPKGFSEFSKSMIKVLFRAILLSALGGFIGQKLYEFRSKKS